jgi:hypothetical protein
MFRVRDEQHKRGCFVPPVSKQGCVATGPIEASVGPAVDERCAHGVDRNSRYEACEEEPADTNPDRECPRERLSRHDIAITNCEAGDESEIDRVAERPALDKANQQAQGNLNRQNRRQDRPREMNSVAQPREEAPPHGL